MGSLLSLIFGINVVIFSVSSSMNVNAAQGIEAPHLLDHVIRDHAFKSYTKSSKTGTLYKVHLPSNYSGVGVDTVRFRCGSLRRYGAKVKEFQFAMGIIIRPCSERVVVIRQNFGKRWSSNYYKNYNVSGYRLVSPVLGIIAYNAAEPIIGDPSEVTILAKTKKPITIDFSNFMKVGASGIRPSCASFGSDGKMSVTEQVKQSICTTTQGGHFGLVIKSLPWQPRSKISRWKLVVGCSIGGVLGAFLLGLLFIALIVKVKKGSRMAEMERRAFEEEALEMSMVGHVRAPRATVTRTLPTIEHNEYTP